MGRSLIKRVGVDMEWLDIMNSALEYIEENLDDIIDTTRMLEQEC